MKNVKFNNADDTADAPMIPPMAKTIGKVVLGGALLGGAFYLGKRSGKKSAAAAAPQVVISGV